MSNELEFTGERMTPNGADFDTFWEHVYRYRLACTLAAGKDVLDIACGEGYGSAALLRAGAKSLVGVDISAETVEHAKRKYGFDARLGSAEAIPVADHSMDLIVSFETVEHVPQPEAFLRECVRVLRPGGTLLISTPNLEVYHDMKPNNEYHCSEMSLPDFQGLISKWFERVNYLGQTTPTPGWVKWRGGYRLWTFGHKFLEPSYPGPLTEETRSQVVELCSKSTSLLGNWLVPVGIRSMGEHDLKRCRYIIAKVSQPRS